MNKEARTIANILVLCSSQNFCGCSLVMYKYMYMYFTYLCIIHVHVLYLPVHYTCTCTLPTCALYMYIYIKFYTCISTYRIVFYLIQYVFWYILHRSHLVSLIFHSLKRNLYKQTRPSNYHVR